MDEQSIFLVPGFPYFDLSAEVGEYLHLLYEAKYDSKTFAVYKKSGSKDELRLVRK